MSNKFSAHSYAKKHIEKVQNLRGDFTSITDNNLQLNCISQLLASTSTRLDRLLAITDFIHCIEGYTRYVLDTLAFCQKYHYKKPDTVFSSTEMSLICEKAKELRQTLEAIADDHKNDADWCN